MKRHVFGLLLLAACLPLSGSMSGRVHVPAHARAAAAGHELLDLVPASAILAIQVRDLDLRWGEIRGVAPIARLQDAALELAGIAAEDLPQLAGAEAVAFIAPTCRRTSLAPIALLRPADPRRAEDILRRAHDLDYRFGRGALWVGPAGAGAFLDRCVLEDSVGFTAVVDAGETDRRLPEGGLVRGWINPRALADVAREASHGTSAAPVRWLQAILATEMAAVRSAGFRRDLWNGEIVSDATIAYEESRLPPALFRLLDPAAAPSFLPPDLPPGTVLAAAIRPEPSAWMPWVRYVAITDARGPLRNLEFWLNEFQRRYRRDLARDLFGALGEHAWLLAARPEASGGTELAVVFELRETAVFDATLTDLLMWLREMAWLDSFGLVVPQFWREVRGDRVALSIVLATPSGRIEALTVHITGNHLIAGTADGIVSAAEDWVECWKRGGVSYPAGYVPPVAHGVALTGGAQLSKLVRSWSSNQSDNGLRLLIDTLAASLQVMGPISAELRYQEGAIHLRSGVGPGQVTPSQGLDP